MENYQKCVDAVYALVTLLTPANRPIAMQYIGCIERLISERIRINPGTLFLLKIIFSKIRLKGRNDFKNILLKHAKKYLLFLFIF